MVRKSWLRSKVEIQTVRNVVTPHVILIVTVCRTMPNTLLNSPRSDEVHNLRARGYSTFAHINRRLTPCKMYRTFSHLEASFEDHKT